MDRVIGSIARWGERARVHRPAVRFIAAHHAPSIAVQDLLAAVFLVGVGLAVAIGTVVVNSWQANQRKWRDDTHKELNQVASDVADVRDVLCWKFPEVREELSRRRRDG